MKISFGKWRKNEEKRDERDDSQENDSGVSDPSGSYSSASPSGTDLYARRGSSFEPSSAGKHQRQLILMDLQKIKKRIKVSKKQWETNNWTYTGLFEENVNESLFPKGYGLYLMSKSTMAKEEETIKNLRQAIMAVPSAEIQDGLLSFLEDYLIQSECLKNLAHEREDTLVNVLDWLETDGPKMVNITSSIVQPALDEEHRLRACCRPTMEMMEKLAGLRKQMAVMDKTKKDAFTAEVLAESIHEAEAQAEESLGETGAANIYKNVSKPIEELKTIVTGVKDKANEDTVADVESRLDDIATLLAARESDIRRARAQYREKSEERERLQEGIERLKEYNEKLHQDIKDIKESQADQAQKTDSKGKAVAIFKEDASTQVCRESMLRDLGVAFKTVGSTIKNAVSLANKMLLDQRAKTRTKNKEKALRRISTASVPQKRSSNLGMETLTSTNQRELQPQSSSVSVNVSRAGSEVALSATPSQGSGTREDKKSSGGQKPPAAGTPAKKKSLHGSKGKAATPRTESKQNVVSVEEKEPETSASQSADKGKGKQDRRRVKEKKEKEDDLSRLPSATEVPVNLEHEKLRTLVLTHISNLTALTQPLLHELMALRRNARRETERIRERELTMMQLERNIKEFLEKAPEDKNSLPRLHLDKAKRNLVVTNRVPDPHRCPLCLCNETTNNTIDVSKLGAAVKKKAGEVMEDYQEVLEKINESYDYLGNTLEQGVRSIQHTLTQVIWTAEGRADAIKQDANDIQNVMELINRKPDSGSIQELVEHALKVTECVNALVKDVVNTLRLSKMRMDHVKSQNEELRELERNVGLAKACMDDCVLHLTRMRAGKELLRNGMMLGIMRCHVCRCYNSCLEDDTRVIKTDDVNERNRMVLLRSMSLIQQALGGVIRKSNANSVTIAVEKIVLEDLQNVQKSLSECLDLFKDDQDQGSSLGPSQGPSQAPSQVPSE